MSIRPDRTASFRKSNDGVKCLFSLVDDVVDATRSGKSFDDELSAYAAEETKKTGTRKKEKK